MKKSVFGTILWILFCSSFAFAGVEDYVGEERANLLRKNGSIDLIHPSGENKLSMIPDCIYTEKINDGLMEKDAKGVPFTAEFLYLIPKSKLLEGSSKESINNNDISVLFRSITRMEGMRYHFSEKKGGEVLYKSAYTIASLNSDQRIPDQIEGSADGKVLYCYQHDHTFKDTKYILHYYQGENILYATFDNTIPMTFLGVKAVMDGKLRLSVLSIDCGDELLLYLSTDVDAKSVPLFNVRRQIQDSMTERIDAIYRWFIVQFK